MSDVYMLRKLAIVGFADLPGKTCSERNICTGVLGFENSSPLPGIKISKIPLCFRSWIETTKDTNEFRFMDQDLSPECRHEAGHAVAARVLGFKVNGIDNVPKEIPGTGGLFGKAGAELEIPSLAFVAGKGEDSVFDILIVLLSGHQAEKKLNPNAKLEVSVEQADGILAFKYAAIALFPPRLKNGQMVSKVDNDQVMQLLSRAEQASCLLVQKHTKAIDALAVLLQNLGKLDACAIDDCLSGHLYE